MRDRVFQALEHQSSARLELVMRDAKRDGSMFVYLWHPDGALVLVMCASVLAYQQIRMEQEDTPF